MQCNYASKPQIKKNTNGKLAHTNNAKSTKNNILNAFFIPIL
jgi:hypothetical protein